MAGTLLQAGARVARRSTAAGLGGLSVALFVGVMSFALTTSPAGQPSEPAARYLSVPQSLVRLDSLSSFRPVTGGTPAVTVVPVGEQSLEASRLDIPASPDEAPTGGRGLLASAIFDPARDGDELRALQAARPRAVVSGFGVAPAELAGTAAPVLPDLAPGDVVDVTVSFYYCEQGELGLHPGDGGGFCGVMRDGSVVYPGAAACAYRYLGQRFRIVGDPLERTYRCADTGSAVHGLHRDVWFMNSDDGWTWQLRVGQVATIEILP